MSYTVLEERGFRFFFFKREQTRMHIHIDCDHGEAKYWLEPTITLANNHNLSDDDLRVTNELIRANHQQIRDTWREKFSG